ATCTAFYMTRLMGLTFWGKERFLEHQAGGEADEAHAAAYDKGQAPHDAVDAAAGDRPRHEPGEHVGPVDHHVHIPHESPRSMWVPLVVLAVLATIGGLVGIGPAFKGLTGSEHPGGKLNISTWLRPVVWDPVKREFPVPNTNEHGSVSEHAATAEGAPGQFVEAPHVDTGF